MDIDDSLYENLPLDKSHESPMEVSFLDQSEMEIDEMKLEDSCNSSINWLSSSFSRSSESDYGSICFNKSILVMLQCEENENETCFPKNNDPKQNVNELVHDENSIEEIDVDVVKKIVENKLVMNSVEYCIIDVRFPYEFRGGHIKGAVNLHTPIKVLKHFFIPSSTVDITERDIEINMHNVVNEIMKLEPFQSKLSLIFHCEFSSVRGPKMAHEFRSIDRFANLRSYPNLYFPNVFIMKNGYKEFYSRYQSYCEPRNYIRMDPDDFPDISIENSATNSMLSQEKTESEFFQKYPKKRAKKEQTKQMNQYKKCVEKQMTILSEIKKWFII